MVAVAKEISLEDVRLGLEKMPDRFMEHPATVLVITNLNYADAPRLMLRDTQLAAALNWQEIRLTGDSAHAYEEQIEEVSDTLADAWSTHPSEKTGNPVYRRPSVLVVYREDHKFLLDSVIPRPGRPPLHYDLILASQPWRARMSAEFKASRVLAPLTRALAPGGRLLVVQSAGKDPALEIIQKLWPGENPFQVDRHALLAQLKTELGRDVRDYTLTAPPDEKALFRYDMRTLPSELSDRIGTSTLFAAWNAAVYVNQIEDERLEPVVTSGAYLKATQTVLQKFGGLWFNDEGFVVSRRAWSGRRSADGVGFHHQPGAATGNMRHHCGAAVQLGDRTEIYGKCQFHFLTLAQPQARSADEHTSGAEVDRLAQRTPPVRQNDVDDSAGAMASMKASFHDNLS